MKICRNYYNFTLKRIANCDNCNIKKLELENKLICGICSTVNYFRPSDYVKTDRNFFSIFDLKEDNYKIDKTFLEMKYKDLQKFVHPDKYALSEKDIIKEAQDCSSYLSNAYKTLKDDFLRADYLLKLKGFKTLDESNHSLSTTEFLEEMLNLQEKIDESQSRVELSKIKADLIEKISISKKELEHGFHSEDLEKVLYVLNLSRFYLTALNHLEKVYDDVKNENEH